MASNSQPTLGMLFSILLGIFIFFLIIIALLILAGRMPQYENHRRIDFDNRPDPWWRGTIQLTSESVFTVGQTITATATVDICDESRQHDLREQERTPKIVFPDARAMDGGAAEILLQEDDGMWTGTRDIVFHKPGEMSFRPEHFGGGSSESIGEIGTEGAYFEYRNQRYTLLFTVVTAIFAAGSLIVALQAG